MRPGRSLAEELDRGWEVLQAKRSRLEPPDSNWLLANPPSEPGPRALIIAGYQSISWNNLHPAANSYTAAALGVAITAGSYNGFTVSGIGQHYTPPDTERDLELSASVLARYLAQAVDAPSVVGISIGGVVGVLGTAEALMERAAGSTASTKPVRRLILVAPAIAPPEKLYRSYEQRAREPDLKRIVPYCIEQLCRVGSHQWQQMRHTMITAFHRIHAAGIPISVVYWPGDLLTPPDWLDDLHRDVRTWVEEDRLESNELGLVDLPRDQPADDAKYDERIVKQHRDFFLHSATIERVRANLDKPS